MSMEYIDWKNAEDMMLRMIKDANKSIALNECALKGIREEKKKAKRREDNKSTQEKSIATSNEVIKGVG